MALSPNPSSRPRLACEITADRVIAARVNASHRALDVYSNRRLPAGTLVPGLSGTNVQNAAALRQAVGSALESVSGGARDVLLIIPDAAVRVLLLDFDDLPQKYEDAASVVRFRAKKSLPFDVESAACSFQVDRSRRPLKVIATFSPRDVIQEYEGIILDAGFNPGVVLPSIIATLGLVQADQPTMIVKVDGGTTTVSIVDGSSLILLRTLEIPGRASLSLQDISSNVLPSMVFFEDTYSAKLERVLVTGDVETQALASSLQNETNLRVEPLAGSNLPGDGLGDTLPPSVLAPVAGGLTGA
ncbi:MAG TPA: hypothetical protein VM009_03295 [Terriglobales bacterium]|nr:hypothetical protein [Terriglobales bacterium]